MESKINYVVVGLFVLIIGAFALIAGVWLSAGLQKKSYDLYQILMYEPVSGLNEQAPVKFNGVQVGFVQSITLNATNPRQVILMVDIEQDTPITKSTVATLMSQGITGVTYIGLKAKTPNADLLKKLPGQTYPIIPSAPSFLMELDTALRELSTNVDSITLSIKRILSDKNIHHFDGIMEHTDNIMRNFDIVAAKLASSSDDFPKTLENFNNTLRALEKASNETSSFLSQGQYTLRQWSTQMAPTTVNFASKMSRIASDLEQVTRELKQQPSLLIRGKNPPPLGPGEQ